MLGAIAGDVIGSVYEASPVKMTDFELFPPGGPLHRGHRADGGDRWAWAPGMKPT